MLTQVDILAKMAAYRMILCQRDRIKADWPMNRSRFFRRPASLAADAKGKGNKAKGKEKGGKPTQETEPADSPDFINPLLEGVDYIDGQLWVAGNRVLINLNLSRNEIGETGLEALLKAMQYQTTLCMENKSSGTGLMRLLVGKNKVRSSHELLQKITDIMLPKDPFYKPPPQTPDVTEA